MCYSKILSGGKDIYATAVGEVVYNLYVNGYIEIGRQSVNLSGTFFAVR